MRLPASITVLALALASVSCGHGASPPAVVATASPAVPLSASPSDRPPARSTPSRPLLDVQEEQALVAGVAESVLAQYGHALSEQLIRSSALVKTQDELHFDRSRRTLVVAVTSVPPQDDRQRTALAYELAKDFAPLLWGSQTTETVRPESMAMFAVKVDSLSFDCAGATMAALADRTLSRDSFAQQCPGPDEHDHPD